MRNALRKSCAVTLCFLMIALDSLAQRPGPPAGQQQPASSGEKPRPVQVLGPGDQIVIRAFEAEEISEKPFRIDAEGYVNLPMLGRIRAGGLTVEQLEAALADRLKTYVKEPQVAVTVMATAQHADQPVFVLGAFKSPGIYPLQERQTLTELLSRVGGLQPNAARRLKLTRRADQGRIPLPTAADDQDGKVSSAEISITTLMEMVNPAEDIVLKPYDVINLPKVELVYVTGELQKTGAFPLEDREFLSVAQLIAMAGGLSPEAAPSKARVLRPVLNTARRSEIAVDVKSILAGKANDFPLLPNDVLLVPRSRKSGLRRALYVALPSAIVAVIYVVSRGM